ncbi:MAG: DNA alkylation repair protein [Gemmatimonas sp.]
MTDDLRKALRALADKEDAVFLQRFFRTGPGEYGEGDRFLGVRVPATRRIVKQFPHATLADALELLQSEWHEERLLALLFMVRLFKRGDAAMQRSVYESYLANMPYVNNWDLVDSSAEHIVGPHLYGKSSAKRVLMKLARSRTLWERRIAMLSTLYFIKQKDFALALEITEQLIADQADLIHKAAGWMLREIGDRDRAVLEAYLEPRVLRMPRTMLRYAIEKFPERKRQQYLKRRVE